jgi:hypothetical protein
MQSSKLSGYLNSGRENLIFDLKSIIVMAEEVFMYAVTTGIFAFLTAILFGSRAARKRQDRKEDSAVAETESYSGSGGEGRRIKRFRSDGSPVNE